MIMYIDQRVGYIYKTMIAKKAVNENILMKPIYAVISHVIMLNHSTKNISHNKTR